MRVTYVRMTARRQSRTAPMAPRTAAPTPAPTVTGGVEVVDGWATVTRNLTARSGKCCGFRHIAWLVITAKGRKSNSVLGIDSSF